MRAKTGAADRHRCGAPNLNNNNSNSHNSRRPPEVITTIALTIAPTERPLPPPVASTPRTQRLSRPSGTALPLKKSSTIVRRRVLSSSAYTRTTAALFPNRSRSPTQKEEAGAHHRLLSPAPHRCCLRTWGLWAPAVATGRRSASATAPLRRTAVEAALLVLLPHLSDPSPLWVPLAALYAMLFLIGEGKGAVGRAAAAAAGVGGGTPLPQRQQSPLRLCPRFRADLGGRRIQAATRHGCTARRLPFPQSKRIERGGVAGGARPMTATWEVATTAITAGATPEEGWKRGKRVTAAGGTALHQAVT